MLWPKKPLVSMVFDHAEDVEKSSEKAAAKKCGRTLFNSDTPLPIRCVRRRSALDFDIGGGDLLSIAPNTPQKGPKGKRWPQKNAANFRKNAGPRHSKTTKNRANSPDRARPCNSFLGKAGANRPVSNASGKSESARKETPTAKKCGNLSLMRTSTP